MHFITFIAVLAVLQYLVFGYLVGRERVKCEVKAPAITGAEGFERMYRVQMNTLEMLVAFLPLLLLAGQYWPAILVAPIGLVYLVGRGLYWKAYVSEPSTRGLGFMLSLIPVSLLLLLVGVGAVMGMFGG